MTEVRAFLAVDLDGDLKPQINKVINEFRQTDTKVKYVEPENLHLTLKFFGDVDTADLKHLKEAVFNVTANFKPFDIKITGCGAFPNTNRIKVIWVGIDDDTILKELHDLLDKEFVRLGFKPDRKFSTHLTIGRVKSGKNKNQIKEKIAKFSDFAIGEMRVDKISLKKSTLTPAGPIYEDLEIFEL